MTVLVLVLTEVVGVVVVGVVVVVVVGVVVVVVVVVGSVVVVVVGVAVSVTVSDGTTAGALVDVNGVSDGVVIVSEVESPVMTLAAK